MTVCTRCQYNDLSTDFCISCAMLSQGQDYRFDFNQYLFDGYNPEQPDTSGSEQCTHLSEDDEDLLRKAMYSLFDLKPLELLCLQAIMQGKSLTQFADDMTRLFQKNQKGCTRFHAFQLRKSIAAKLPSFRDALVTSGQRKMLKR